MEILELIRGSLIRSRDLVLARVEDLREHCLVPPTPRGGAHALWTLGHLADARRAAGLDRMWF